jgi:ABC-2 type transport system permease protein
MSGDRNAVLTWVLQGQRRALLLWAAALAGVAAMYTSVFPVMGGEEMEEMAESFPEGMLEAFGYEEIGTAAGYIGSSVYGLLGPILLFVFGIGLGARLIAGEEEAGTLELELTGPTSRRSLYLQRLAALLLELAAMVVVVMVTVAVLTLVLDLDVGMGKLIQATLGLLLVTMAMGALALAAGAATGRRAVALGAAAGVAVVSWVLNAVGPAIDAGWMMAISPVSWFTEQSPLLHGADLLGLVLLAGLTVVAAAAGLVAFERRDLMV